MVIFNSYVKLPEGSEISGAVGDIFRGFKKDL